MAVAETTMAPAPSATANIDQRLNTLVSLVEQRTADLTTMTAAVNKAAAAADKAAATVAVNLGDHGSLPTTYVPTPVPVLVETSFTPTLQPFVVPKTKPSTPTKCSMECRDAETYEVMPTLSWDLSFPTILLPRRESMYVLPPMSMGNEQQKWLPPTHMNVAEVNRERPMPWPSFICDCQRMISLQPQQTPQDKQPWGRNAFNLGHLGEMARANESLVCSFVSHTIAASCQVLWCLCYEQKLRSASDGLYAPNAEKIFHKVTHPATWNSGILHIYILRSLELFALRTPLMCSLLVVLGSFCWELFSVGKPWGCWQYEHLQQGRPPDRANYLECMVGPEDSVIEFGNYTSIGADEWVDSRLEGTSLFAIDILPRFSECCEVVFRETTEVLIWRSIGRSAIPCVQPTDTICEASWGTVQHIIESYMPVYFTYSVMKLLSSSSAHVLHMADSWEDHSNLKCKGRAECLLREILVEVMIRKEGGVVCFLGKFIEEKLLNNYAAANQATSWTESERMSQVCIVLVRVMSVMNSDFQLESLWDPGGLTSPAWHLQQLEEFLQSGSCSYHPPFFRWEIAWMFYLEYSDRGNTRRQLISAAILSKQFHWQIDWSIEVLELECSVIVRTFVVAACTLHQLRSVIVHGWHSSIEYFDIIHVTIHADMTSYGSETTRPNIQCSFIHMTDQPCLPMKYWF